MNNRQVCYSCLAKLHNSPAPHTYLNRLCCYKVHFGWLRHRQVRIHEKIILDISN